MTFSSFPPRTLLQVTDRDKRMSHCHPQLLRGTERNLPGSTGLTKAVGKGKGRCQNRSATRDIKFSRDKHPPPQTSSGGTWTMLSSPCTSYLATDSPFTHNGLLGSIFNLHLFFLSRYFLGVVYRRVSYLEDKIYF